MLSPVSHKAVLQDVGVDFSSIQLQVDDAQSSLTEKQPNNEHLDIRHMESMSKRTVKGSFVYIENDFQTVPVVLHDLNALLKADHLHGSITLSCLSGGR